MATSTMVHEPYVFDWPLLWFNWFWIVMSYACLVVRMQRTLWHCLSYHYISFRHHLNCICTCLCLYTTVTILRMWTSICFTQHVNARCLWVKTFLYFPPPATCLTHSSTYSQWSYSTYDASSAQSRASWRRSDEDGLSCILYIHIWCEANSRVEGLEKPNCTWTRTKCVTER